MLSFPVLFALTLAQLACPNGTCRPNPIAWRTRSDDPGRVYLYVDGKQHGGYDRAHDQWRDFDLDANRWSQPRALFAEHDAPNFGVMRDRLADRERFSLGGVPVDSADARQTLAGFADDSRALHLTMIGSNEECRAVADDLDHHPTLAPLRQRLRVQRYAADHWAVAGLGFANGGKPTIYLQAPDGRVLHRQDEYRGPERLAAVLRKADADYRPEGDPDLDPSPAPFHVPRAAWVGLAALSLLFISRRRNPA